MDFTLANTISAQIEKYDKAVANAEDDERDMLDIYDYVDEQYRPYIESSKKYWGIITDRKKAPCAYLLYQGSIREEIGLIKCKSESTKKEYMTAVIDGAIAEHYKFLKNDLLKVDVVLLIETIFKRLGREIFNVEKLRQTVANDPTTWDIYAKGLTIGVNQCEKPATIEKLKRYKPRNVSELASFIAAIRPGFKSMYRKFESREPFSYGIPALDNLIQTKEIPNSYILFQENLMTILNYASFAMSETYQAVKDIAKKKADKVKALKDKFEEGCAKQIVADEHVSPEDAKEIAVRIWRIINDSSSYLFNACLAGDTEIQLKGCKKTTIEDLYLHTKDKDWIVKNKGEPYWLMAQGRKSLARAYSMRPDMNFQVCMNQIVDVRLAGVRDTYRLMLESGISVVATDNHKFPTPEGEKRLDQLRPGDKLYVADKYLKTHLEAVWSIEYEKQQMTYDVEMKAPYHNFMLTNGLIVSNSHAYCMALDSLYCAYLKAHYPYEFYEVLLQFYSDKGNKDKVRLIKQEMRAFGIEEGPYRFGLDNRKFLADPEYRRIIPSLLSIKALSQKCANAMYELGQQSFPDFLHLYRSAQHAGVNSKQLDILIKIGYFADFGTQKQLDQMIEAYNLLGWRTRQSVNLDELPDWMWETVERFVDDKGNFLFDTELDLAAIRAEKEIALNQIVEQMKKTYKTKKASLELIKSHASLPEVEKYYATQARYDARLKSKKLDVSESRKDMSLSCLLAVCDTILEIPSDYSTVEKIQREFACLGYLATDYSKLKPEYMIVSDIDSKYATRKVTLYRICDGEEIVYKIFSRTWEELPLKKGDVLRIREAKQDYKRRKDESGKWVPTGDLEWILQRYDIFQNFFEKNT